MFQFDLWYSSKNSAVGGTDAFISGTSDQELYKTYRYGSSFSYDIPLAKGRYNVTFYFAETHHDATERRKFNVAMEGNEVISGLDVFQMVGKNQAFVLERQVIVSDFELNIQFSATVDAGMISAMKISGAGTGIRKYLHA